MDHAGKGKLGEVVGWTRLSWKKLLGKTSLGYKKPVNGFGYKNSANGLGSKEALARVELGNIELRPTMLRHVKLRVFPCRVSDVVI
ncbi:hypothetical protein L1987_61557 [Smallanthus sonchifolius]|uniref:Uncharacterized protein n=1 Tax=Smallanthus sonchifolius TaxID=185202 RepID=A0ACB9C7Z3_9ASTR|nr:hypothetical protein L1987_61557 [Smallanthus sonchifolius]